MQAIWKLSGLLTILLIAGCSVTPQPFTPVQRMQQLQDNLTQLQLARPKLGKQLSLHHAIARACKYNLDYRVQLAEQAIAQTDMSIANFNMLPNLIANAGYVDRSNINEVLSPSTGQVSTAESRVRRLANLTYSWNALDFGVSYFESKQKADEVMIAQQKRRKMLQRIAKDTRSSFWRAIAAVNYLKNSQGFPEELKDAIKKSQTAETEKIISPLEAARYRRDLWVLYNQLTSLQFDLARAKPELMSLISAPERARVELVIKPNEKLVLPHNFPERLDMLDQIALYARPELQEENYRKRISLNEIYKARLRLLPGFEVNYGSYYDSNSYLVNNNWKLLGLSLSWNILKSLANLQGISLAQQQSVLADVRRVALSMAIITQVEIAKLSYTTSSENLFTSLNVLNSERQVYNILLKQQEADLESKLILIKAKAALIFAQLKYDIAFAQRETAAAELIDSVGLDPIYDLQDVDMPMDQLTESIGRVMANGSVCSPLLSHQLQQIAKEQEANVVLTLKKPHFFKQHPKSRPPKRPHPSPVNSPPRKVG